jgi:hypothetical protein
VSPTDIANNALLRLGAAHIVDINESTVRGQDMAAAWPIARDRLLAAYRWQFAMQRASLPADADKPAWGYSYAYTLPADFLRIDQVGEVYVGASLTDYRDSDEADFAMESGKILTNLGAPLSIRYIRRVPDSATSSYAPHFVAALSLVLANDVCYRVTQSNALKQTLMAEVKDIIVEAIRVGAVQKPPQPLPDDSWMIGRL